MQRLTSNRLIRVLLRLRRRAALNGSVLPCDLLLGLGDVVESRRVEPTSVLRRVVRCVVVVTVARNTVVGQSALGYGCWATLGGLGRASDCILGVGDLADDLGGELLANVLLGASSGPISDGALLVREDLLRGSDLGEEVGIDGDKHL